MSAKRAERQTVRCFHSSPYRYAFDRPMAQACTLLPPRRPTKKSAHISHVKSGNVAVALSFKTPVKHRDDPPS